MGLMMKSIDGTYIFFQGLCFLKSFIVHGSFWVILSKNWVIMIKPKKGLQWALIDTLLTSCPLMYPLLTTHSSFFLTIPYPRLSPPSLFAWHVRPRGRSYPGLPVTGNRKLEISFQRQHVTKHLNMCPTSSRDSLSGWLIITLNNPYWIPSSPAPVWEMKQPWHYVFGDRAIYPCKLQVWHYSVLIQHI